MVALAQADTLAKGSTNLVNKNKNLADYNGKRFLQKTIIEAYGNFRADCLILGHADSVKTETLNYLKNLNTDLKISQWFLDHI